VTEEEALAWASARFDGPAIGRLHRLAEIVARESEHQNLIARSTLNEIWSRHIVDSLQLLSLAGTGRWLDIGTGAGFPGLAIAAAEPDRQISLVEPRKLRADYLRSAVAELELPHVSVHHAKVEAIHVRADIISARAVSRVSALFASASGCSDNDTLWLLPKGRNAEDEVAEARRSWHGVFHVEQSITNPESAIVVARHVRQR